LGVAHKLGHFRQFLAESYPPIYRAARIDEGLILAIRSKRHQNGVLRASKVEVVLKKSIM
jgi:hypothetical protein